MDIVIKQQFVIKYNLSFSETLVFSFIQTYRNVLLMNELINFLQIQKEADIRKAVVSLLDKNLICFVIINGIQYLKIKK